MKMRWFIRVLRRLYREWMMFSAPLRFRFICDKLSHKNQITVVFFALNMSMWNYQKLYELFAAHHRFKVYIVLSPIITFNPKQIVSDLNGLRTYFKSKNIDFIDFNYESKEVPVDVRKELNPDILFYTQPYPGTSVSKHAMENFIDKLLCYVPYAFWTSSESYGYDMFLHRFAWKLFYSTTLHKEDAVKYSRNKGRNVVITGYPKTDLFLSKPYMDFWKIKDRGIKRIIWAPHFTITDETVSASNHSMFLSMADQMVQIAQKFSNHIQIAFKPHPRLKTELYKHSQWGEDRTNRYFQEWEAMDNTFILDRDYIDLFMTSDAMIHDSASFAVEYMYSGNPVMFCSADIGKYKQTLNQLGRDAIDAHYIGGSNDDITDFIVGIITSFNDVKKSKRDAFYHDYLIGQSGANVSQNIFNDILNSIGVK